MTKLIGFIVLVIALVVGYQYFFGNPTEKERASKIVSEVKDVGEEVKDLFKEQKEKYERGDYDKVLDKIGSFVDNLKSHPEDLDANETNNLKQIEKEIKKLRKKLDKVSEEDSGTIRTIEKEIRSLVEKANDLIKEMESKE
jgi:predicted RNase H-like nuclease (RuvC/YqgF family)